MIASLPMYDWPEVREATDQWWAGIARHAGFEIGLYRGEPYDAPWHSDDLVFSQTCGYPFTHEFKGRLNLVGTPHYDAKGCVGHRYSSVIFSRSKRPLETFRGCIAAVNSPTSMSGMLALKAVFYQYAKHGQFFGSVIRTGGHLASLAAVRDAKADVCATDAVCVALARRYCPESLKGLVEIGYSPLVPGLPYVTGSGELAKLQGAVLAAIRDPALRKPREALLIDGFSVTNARIYEEITKLEAEIDSLGGLALL